MKKIAIIIPCYNEEKGLDKVLSGIPYEKLQRYGFSTHVIVVDNNSTDNTARVARSRNVTLLYEPKKGKGNAVKTALYAIDKKTTDYVVMLDGDNTYNPKELLRLIEPLDSNFCDVVVGSRMVGKIHKGSLAMPNRIANWAYTFLVRVFYRVNTTDVLSGYYAWKMDVINNLLPRLQSNGFSIEMEMTIKVAKMGYQIYSVPITYQPRIGESKLDSVTDGLKILYTFVSGFFLGDTKPSLFSTRLQLGKYFKELI